LNPWRRIAGLLPLFAAGAAAWAYPALMSRFGRDTGYVWLALSVPIFLGLLTVLAFFTAPPRPEPAGERRVWLWVIFAGATLLFCLSAGRDLEKFPRVIDGEGADANKNAELMILFAERGKLGERVRDQAHAYNMGLVPIMVPTVILFGSGQLAAKWTNIVFMGLLLGGGLAFAAARIRLSLPRSAWLLVWLTPVFYGALLASVRQYRWHVAALVASIGFAMTARAFQSPQCRRSLWWGLVVFLLGLTLYHGCVIYAPAFALLAIWHIFQPEGGTRQGKLVIFFLLLGPAFVGFVAAVGTDYGLALRAGSELSGVNAFLNRDLQVEISRRWLETPGSLLTWSGATILLMGFAALLRRVRRCSFARANLLLLAAGLGTNILAQGFGNPSQNLWFVYPVLVCAALGLADAMERVFAAIPSAPIAGTLSVAICSVVISQEWGAYRTLEMFWRLDSAPRPFNTSEQLALAVREIARSREVESIPTRHFLPASDLPRSVGGFPREVRLEQLGEADLRNMVEFSSLEELQHTLDLEAHAPGQPPGVDVVWVSWQSDEVRPDPTPLEEWLKSQGFRARLLTLESAPDSETIQVWKYSRRR
jgi:hypothetical protein